MIDVEDPDVLALGYDTDSFGSIKEEEIWMPDVHCPAAFEH